MGNIYFLLTLFVVYPECLLELPLHLLLVLLNEELGSQLNELGELEAPAGVGVDLANDLLEKQKLEGTKREYKFITSKRKADCDKKRYKIREQKFYDIDVDKKKERIKDELVFEDKDESEWVEVIPNTLVEKVWRFVCLYRPEENK